MRALYAGMDVHSQFTLCVVKDGEGKVINESLIQTAPRPLVGFVRCLGKGATLTFEEGTHSAWLYDLLRPHVYKLIVCDPGKSRPKDHKDDRTDAHRLVDMLRAGTLSPVYHGDHGTRKLKELVRGYQNVVEDCTRARNRLKAVFRSRGISACGKSVYGAGDRETWLSKLGEPGIRRRVELLYRELDPLLELKDLAQEEMLAEAGRHKACRILSSLPGFGPIRSAIVVAIVDTPFRFRTKRQFWKYCGLAVVGRSSSDYELRDGGGFRRKQKHGTTRGLNRNFNRHLKVVFKGAALDAQRAAMKPYYQARIEAKMRPEMVRLTLARKLSAMCLAIWKRGEPFDVDKALMMTE